MLETRTKLEIQKEKLREQLADVEKRLSEKTSLTIEQQIAEELHGTLCHANHTDQCSWGYENWDALDNVRSSVKGRYLDMAKRALRVTDADTILGIVKVINE